MKTLQSGAISVVRFAETERVLFDYAALYPEATQEVIDRNKAWLDGRFHRPDLPDLTPWG